MKNCVQCTCIHVYTKTFNFYMMLMDNVYIIIMTYTNIIQKIYLIKDEQIAKKTIIIFKIILIPG